MAYKQSLFALIAVASPLWASQPEALSQPGAPAAPPDARYCLRVDPITGSRIETIQCNTREEWAALGLDIDQEWRDNGVRIITTPPNSHAGPGRT